MIIPHVIFVLFKHSFKKKTIINARLNDKKKKL